MNLSEHFTLEEFTFSQTAARKGIDNNPPEDVLEALQHTAECMEELRELLGHPININSAYRSPALNKAVGSKGTSQHLTGEAVDFTCSGFGTPAEIVEHILDSDIEYDQVILEFDRWVHISFSQTRNRKQALIIDNSGTRAYA